MNVIRYDPDKAEDISASIVVPDKKMTKKKKKENVKNENYTVTPEQKKEKKEAQMESEHQKKQIKTDTMKGEEIQEKKPTHETPYPEMLHEETTSRAEGDLSIFKTVKTNSSNHFSFLSSFGTKSTEDRPTRKGKCF